MKRGLLRDNCLVIYTTWRRVANKITQKVLGGLLFIIIFLQLSHLISLLSLGFTLFQINLIFYVLCMEIFIYLFTYLIHSSYIYNLYYIDLQKAQYSWEKRTILTE